MFWGQTPLAHDDIRAKVWRKGRARRVNKERPSTLQGVINREEIDSRS